MPGFIVGVALCVVGCVALYAYLRWRSKLPPGRRLRRPAPKVRYPVVLIHGLMGFDQIAVAGQRRDYFRGVRDRLVALGADVQVIKVSPFAPVEVRAQQLTDAVNALAAKKVNLIAHSLGGLDARYAISRLSLAPKIASLVTIGTPHHGTPLADLGTRLGNLLSLRRVLESVGLNVNVFYGLTTQQMVLFNQQVPDAKGIWYSCLLASADKGLNPLLLPMHRLLRTQAGKNDGVVPFTSQRWGEVLAEVEADHWAQIGWTQGFDAPSLYVKILDELRARGF